MCSWWTLHVPRTEDLLCGQLEGWHFQLYSVETLKTELHVDFEVSRTEANWTRGLLCTFDERSAGDNWQHGVIDKKLYLTLYEQTNSKNFEFPLLRWLRNMFNAQWPVFIQQGNRSNLRKNLWVLHRFESICLSIQHPHQWNLDRLKQQRTNCADQHHNSWSLWPRNSSLSLFIKRPKADEIHEHWDQRSTVRWTDASHGLKQRLQTQVHLCQVLKVANKCHVHAALSNQTVAHCGRQKWLLQLQKVRVHEWQGHQQESIQNQTRNLVPVTGLQFQCEMWPSWVRALRCVVQRRSSVFRWTDTEFQQRQRAAEFSRVFSAAPSPNIQLYWILKSPAGGG